jgi:hypothetical protein
LKLIPQELRDAYRRTEYWVGIPPDTLCLRIGEFAMSLPGWMQTRFPEIGFLPGTPWAYLTAWNPGSKLLSEKENRLSQAELESRLCVECSGLIRGIARDPLKQWPDEEGILAVELASVRALEWGRVFGQNAIVAGRGAGKVELLFCPTGRSGIQP